MYTAHSQVHEVEELLQHLSHDGEISFRQAVSHSRYIHLLHTHTHISKRLKLSKATQPVLQCTVALLHSYYYSINCKEVDIKEIPGDGGGTDRTVLTHTPQQQRSV